MTTVPKGNTVLPWQHALPLLVGLVAAGLGGNYLKFELFFNIQYIFGSIFAMLALQLLGVRLGILAALLISSITYQLWNHPYAMVIMTGEVAFVGLLVRRRALNLVAADALYWICLGMPLVYLCYHGLMHLSLSNATITMVKQAVNGIANTLVARLLYMGISCRLKQSHFLLQEVVFNLLTVATLATALFLLAGQSRSEALETDRSIQGALGLASQRVSINLTLWLQDHSERMTYLAKRAATDNVPQMQDRLEQVREMNRDYLRLGLMDERANSVAFFPRMDELGRSNIGKDYSDRPFLPTLRQTLQPMFSEIVIGKIGRPKPIVIALAPVVREGEYAGFMAGVLDLQRVHRLIALNASSHLLQGLLFTLVDNQDRIIATNRTEFRIRDTFRRGRGELRELGGGISQWLPLSHKNISISERWKDSFYLAETDLGQLAEWTLILELPIAPIQKRLYEKYAAYLAEVLALILVALLLAKVTSQGVVVSLEELQTISANIPAKLATQAAIDWPETTILETATLVDNFREMSGALALQLKEIRDMNADLEERVSQRTRELQDSEGRLRSLSENLADGMVYQIDSGRDGSKRRFSYLSPAVERLHGLKVEDVQTHPELLYNQVIESHQPLVAEQEALAFATQTTFDIDVMVRLPSGEVRWRRFVSVPHRQADGTILWDGIELDITEHKRMEESLRKSEALLKQTQQISRVGGWEYDVASQKVTWTDEVYRIYGVGATFDLSDITQAVSFYADQDQTVLTNSFQRAVDTGAPYDLELQFLSADGQRKWLRTMGQAECVAGQTVRVFGHIMDITERKEIEERIRQSLREKETLLKEVHHRVKNNMAVVSSLLNLQAKQIKDDRLRGMFDESQQRIKSIALVHEKLYRSKDIACIDFRDYIATIINELRSTYRHGGGEIQVNVMAEGIVMDIDTAIPCGLIINELVTNALKYAFPGNGSGQIAITVTKSDTLYTMVVTDNGIGLPKDFDHAQSGTLGLQLVEALTRQLRGGLEIRSEAGTQVVITFRRKGECLGEKI